MDYALVTFKIYDNLLSKRVKLIVEDVCGLLRPLSFPDDESGFRDDEEPDSGLRSEEEDILVGTKLFELYLAMQQFYQLGGELSEEGTDFMNSSRCSDSGAESTNSSSESVSSLENVHNYHKWFTKAVAKWLDIALFKAMKRILRAVHLDKLDPVDDLVRHTTSAVDIRTVFGQIRTFWKQLKWPDPETGFVFISRILDDVCRAAIFYAERMKEKVNRLRNVGTMASVIELDSDVTQDGQLFFSREQCLAINNIDHVLQSIQPLVSELGMSDV